jgi:hypothetical protein
MVSSASSMLVRDAESHELRPLIRIPPTLTSQKAPWEGFKFALYLSAAYENSAYEVHSPIVVLKLGGPPSENKSGGWAISHTKKNLPRRDHRRTPRHLPRQQNTGSYGFCRRGTVIRLDVACGSRHRPLGAH